MHQEQLERLLNALKGRMQTEEQIRRKIHEIHQETKTLAECFDAILKSRMAKARKQVSSSSMASKA